MLDRAGQGRAGQGRAGQGRAGHGRAGQGRAGQGRAIKGRGMFNEFAEKVQEQGPPYVVKSRIIKTDINRDVWHADP